MSGDLAVIDPPEVRRTATVPASQPVAATAASADQATITTEQAGSWRATAGSLLELTKPRIVVMILITALVALVFVAGTQLSLITIFHLMVGTAAVAGSASVLNQFMERDADSKMARTKKRPLPSSKVSAQDALLFGLGIGLLGTVYLALFSGVIPAIVGVATWVGYVVIYTPLKRVTAWNTTVGAIAGALPMLMGYTAAGGGLWDAEGWLLVAVLFLWQYPHFMAIAWMYRGQYADAGFKMTPVIEPTGRSAGWQAIAGSLSLPIILVTLILPLNYAPLFAVLAFAASFGMIRSAFRFCGTPDDANARRLLRSSLLQLPASLAVLTIARLLS